MYQRVCDFVYDPQMNKQAAAILALLHHTNVGDARIAEWDDTTRCYKYWSEIVAWHNGRENGFVLSVAESFVKSKQLNIVCVESRHSDDIVFYIWESCVTINPINLSDFSDDIYKNNRHSFMCQHIWEAYEYILIQIKNYLLSEVKE